MSKVIKQMQMDALKQTFKGVQRPGRAEHRQGSTRPADNKIRRQLRKKNIRLQMVKNSLARRVFDETGVKLGRLDVWAGTTIVAWGGRQRQGPEPGSRRRAQGPRRTPKLQGQGQGQAARRRGQPVAVRAGPDDADAAGGDRRDRRR